jgi:hypothetical protein
LVTAPVSAPFASASPRALTALLHASIQEFGVQPDGRLFVGERNGSALSTMTIGRVWRGRSTGRVHR